MKKMWSKLNVFVAITFLVTFCNVVVPMATESDSDRKTIVSIIPFILAAGSNNTVPTVTSTTGEVWMDRNLGASRVATSSTDSGAYGDLYQWGRGTDGHEKRTSAKTSVLSSSDTPGHGSFITGGRDWRATQNDDLWQGEAGINNPCPSGFRLPTSTELGAERVMWSPDNNSAGAFASPLKLVVAGYRDFSNASFYFAGSNGFYWSSTVSGCNVRSLNVYSGTANVYGFYRAYGFSVRCLKD